MGKVRAYKGPEDPTYLVVFEDTGMVREMNYEADQPNGVNMYVGSPDEYILDPRDLVHLKSLPKGVLVGIVRAQ